MKTLIKLFTSLFTFFAFFYGYGYNDASQLLGMVNKTKYGAYFQATSSRNYEYDVFGNLNQVSWASQTRNYKYDPYDRRIATYHNGAVQSKLIYGLESVPVAELNENDRIINTFVYADGYAPLLMRKGNTDYYLISDIRGSVRMVIKVSTGDVRQRMDYDAFGNVLEDTNPGYTPFGYAGGLYDYRANLVRFGARDYFPEIGRWTAEDPIGFWSGDVNFYAYVSNDPVNYVDPSGLSKSDGCSSNIWRVGPYKDLKGLDGLQAHHVGQRAVMSRLIDNYNPNTAPSILVPARGHTLGNGVLARGTSGFVNVRQLLARDIFELRRVYPGIPRKSLQQLIQLNKKMYPEEFSKCH